MRKALITGGAGFVGVHLADHLLTTGDYEVTVLDNESLGDRNRLDLNHVRFIGTDLRDLPSLAGAVADQDVVVHLAADTRVMDSVQDPVHNFENNVTGSFNLLQSCRQAGVRRLVAASTGGAILGDVPPPVHEAMAPQPTSPYGASKLMLEGYLSAYTAAYGLSSCALRFSNIYGPRSFHKGSVVAQFFKQMLAGRPLTVYGDGSQARDFLFVGDLVEAIEAAMSSDVSGAYQLGSGEPTTVNELLDVIREATGRDPQVEYADFRPGEVRQTWCQIEKARAALGFDPKTPLDVGIRATWEWFSSSAAS